MTDGLDTLREVLTAPARDETMTYEQLWGAVAPAGLMLACAGDGSIAPLRTADGSSWMALFTDPGQIATIMHPDTRGVQTTGHDAGLLAVRQSPPWGVVVDAGTPHQLAFEPQVLEALGLAAPAVPEGSPHDGVSMTGGVLVGAAVEPIDRERAFAAYNALAAEPLALVAWDLLWMIQERHAEPALVIAVIFDTSTPADDRTPVLQRIHAAIAATPTADTRRVDVTDVDAVPGVFEDHMRTVPPMFNRLAAGG